MHQFSSNFPFPFHSIMIMQNGKMLMEEYFPPFKKDGLHRMFSITKSFTSLAVGALVAEGRLNPDDRICDLFPEYMPADADDRLTGMTVRDMLMMRTCHKATTYKTDMTKHWVESFFMTSPDHAPGRIFKYDTSSAHTLAALVKKISGKGVLDYLREIYLDAIGFSKDAHILTDPFGCEIGGSGLVARPSDLLKTAQLLLSLYNGKFLKEYPELTGDKHDRIFWENYTDYIKEAMSFQSPTLHEGKTIDEMQGYGYQFWMIRDGGVMMYGMGGQYVVLYPDKELIFITTADTQSVQGGTQYILDEIRWVAMSADVITEGSHPLTHSANITDMASSSSDTHLTFSPSTSGENGSGSIFPAADDVSLMKGYYGSYRLLPNTSGFKKLTLTESELTLDTDSGHFVFPYGLNEAAASKESVYGQQIYTRAYPQPDDSLYLRVQILDEYVGCIHIMMNKENDEITVSLRKVEESLYKEFNCFLGGVRE